MSEPNTELPQHGAAEGHHEHGHHHDHLVQVTIDGHHKQIKKGDYVVSELKEALGVDASKALDQVDRKPVRAAEWVSRDHQVIGREETKGILRCQERVGVADLSTGVDAERDQTAD